MKSKTNNAGVSKNFSFEPAGGVSSMMNVGTGGISPNQNIADPNAAVSINIRATNSNSISKNFTEADAAAKAALRVKTDATHKVLRKPW